MMTFWFLLSFVAVLSSFCEPYQTKPLAFSSMVSKSRFCKYAAKTADERTEDDHDDKSLMLELMKLSLSQAVPQALKIFIELGIPDLMMESSSVGGLTVANLRTLIATKQPTAIGPHIHEDGLFLSLRILASVGVVVEETTKSNDSCRFRLSRMGSLLTTARGKSSLEPMVRYFLDEPLWQAWGVVPSYIQELYKDSNKSSEAKSITPFHAANGMTSNEYYSRPEHAYSLQHANDFVRFVSEQEVLACVEGFDWATLSLSGKKTVVDIGGHSGKVMEAVVTRHPDLRCICLDLPEVIRESKTNENSTVELIEGDMFDHTTIPVCDAIFMKHVILCDWDEAKSRAVLECCYKALPRNGLLIIGESLLPDPPSLAATAKTTKDDHRSLPLYVDFFMMIDGRSPSKTQSEWAKFCWQSGFQLEGVQDTLIPTCSILTFRKVI